MQQPLHTSEDTVPVCRVCGGRNARQLLQATEKMFGLGDTFAYMECGECGSLSQVGAGFDPDRFYPPTYYSFTPSPRLPFKGRLAFAIARNLPDWMVHLGRQMRDSHALSTVQETRDQVREWTGGTRLRACRVLDVGCGSGERSLRYHYAGCQMEGVDPFFQGPNPREFPIHRRQLEDLSGEHDLVLFQHSLEHMPDPRTALAAAFRLLRSGGACVVGIPKLPNAAFTEYRENWFALDAPRHYFIPSEEGMKRLSERAGFGGLTIHHEPDDDAVCWSEAYRRGLARHNNSLAASFTEAELRALREFAARALREEKTSQATFILRKTG